MLRSMVFAALLAIPAMVMAQDADPSMHWRDCTTDEDCIAVQGTCNLTAVNAAYKDDAVVYYKKLQATANCVPRFWQPTKGLIPECKPIAGSRASKDAQVVPHSACAMVPKPQAKKQE